MLKSCHSVLEAIGRTPLIRMNKVAEGLPCPVYAKVEFFNPGQSVKDRIGLAMIEDAEKRGLIQPGKNTIIEATSGNTGVGLAMVAAVKGYRCIFVMPDKMSVEKIRLLQAYGAEVVIVPTNVAPDSPDSYASVAARLQHEMPGAWQPNQFANLTNPEIHYRTTGPEIWEQTEGRITCFVAGIGTGGTISGVGKFLKEKNPSIKVVGADPEGSILSGGTPAAWKVEGIGEDYVPKTFNSQVVDDWVRVSDRESFLVGRKMARLEGLLVGGSCGTVMAAALHYAERLGPDDLVVAITPDTGRNYLSKMYSDEWMQQMGYLETRTAKQTAGDVLDSQPERQIFSVRPEQPAEDAVQILRSKGVSQLPVIEDAKVVGQIKEITLARLLHDHHDPRKVAVREVMGDPLPVVEEQISLDEVYRILMSGHSGVVVTRRGKLAGIITRIDLVEFWDKSVPQPGADGPTGRQSARSR